MTKIKKFLTGIFAVVFAVTLGFGGVGVKKTMTAKALTTDEDEAFASAVLNYVEDQEEEIPRDTLIVFVDLIEADSISVNPLYNAFVAAFADTHLPKIGFYDGVGTLFKISPDGTVYTIPDDTTSLEEMFRLGEDALTIVVSNDYQYDEIPFDPPQYWIIKNPTPPDIIPGPPPFPPGPPREIMWFSGTIYGIYDSVSCTIEEPIF